MRPEFLLGIAFLVSVMILVGSYLGGSGSPGECVFNSDCVAEQCCHPISCVPKGLAPDCSMIFCTQECVPGTMDCLQGHCSCVNGKCEAIIDW